MIKKENSDRKEELITLLAGISGHFEVKSPKDERSIQSLQETLAKVLYSENITTVKNSFFSAENSDLFFSNTIAPHHLSRLKSLADKIVKEAHGADLRVFVRELPVRSTQIKGSVPLWAGGASIEKTIGPFLNKDGRRIWFDFFRIEELIALYIDGRPNPTILFNVSLLKRFFIDTLLPPIVDPMIQYKLMPDSVWISSEIFAPNAPAGFYTGLKIKQGEITLSIPPQIINGRLTISPNTTVTVKLDLDQSAAIDADPDSQFGIDARNARLDLPKKLCFRFSGSGGTIDEIAGNPHLIIYGYAAKFKWNNQIIPTYDTVLNRVLIPFTCSKKTFAINNCQSPFNTFAETADIQWSAWALPAAQIDVTKPSPAAGIGGIAIRCEKGLTAKWKGLQGGEVNLTNPYVLCDTGRINITDLQAGNLYCNQEYKLWKDEVNPFGSSIKLQYTNNFPFLYNAFANGNEALQALANANPLVDRPVTVSGQALDIHSKNSILLLAVHKAFQLIYLYDDNILFDNYNPDQPKATPLQPLALALNNALFKVTPVNGCLLFGELADDMVKVEKGNLFLTFGMYAYLPTLPDPYAANLNRLRYQFRRAAKEGSGQMILLWLVCQTKWKPVLKDKDNVKVSFHFAPLQAISQTTGIPSIQPTPALTIQSDLSNHPFVKLFINENINSLKENKTASAGAPSEGMKTKMLIEQRDYQAIWDEYFSLFQDDVFAMLDVSSNANQMGVSFAWFEGERMAMLRTFEVETSDTIAATSQFPLQVKDLDVVAKGFFVRAFTVPQISWEPVLNLTNPYAINPTNPNKEPPLGHNYYPNDGGPARIFNNSIHFVPLAPIPLSNFIVDRFENEKGNITASLFTLPFGIRAIAALNKDTEPAHPPTIQHNSHTFPNDLKGGIQLQFNAGKLPFDDYSLFHGGTLQINNILNIAGQKTFTSTLGDSVTLIFNNEFQPKLNDLLKSRGVPLTRIDFSGYGSSIFSNWFNPDAQFAQTSQAKFDVFVGRTAHEVIQVRSIIHKGAIRVVRTIILYRSASGYVYRVDTGWKAESDGKFDFSYRLKDPADPAKMKLFGTDEVYNIHPGIIKGLYNIKNITEVGKEFTLPNFVKAGDYYVDDNNNTVQNTTGNPVNKQATLKMVEFDADVEIEGAIQGHVKGRVPAKKIRGYVQLAPRGIPLSADASRELHISQGGAIGGPLDCIIDIGENGQKMRINRIDTNTSTDASGAAPVFVAAARGNVILPKDGSWSMVMHQHSSGEVVPLPDNITVPLIRIGQLTADKFVEPVTNKENYTLKLKENPNTQLLRIANPTEILRQAVKGTINYGFLQTTDTQKVLFLTPAFEKLKKPDDEAILLSKTPPLFADAYRMISAKGIFPNIGDAVNSFGDAIALSSNLEKNPTFTDGGKQLWNLLQINEKTGDKIKNEGYKLKKQIEDLDFPLPDKWKLIDEDYLKIYVEYKRDKKNVASEKGGLDFDINSFTDTLSEKWKSRLNNIQMVLDMGPFERLMIIKGNFDSKKGSETSFKGSETDPAFPAPQIEFSPVLQAVMDILQILQDLQGEKYGDALKKGLKIAMSNSADSWEYKFEASKEIPVVKFPIPDSIYNDPMTPLKLEASMKVGVYFNAALKVTTDPKNLLPTAGAYLDFYGRLSVMCVSLSAATVYAVGQVNLGIAADTKVGPSLKMKFGFGAQIVVGLPVVGNVSVLYLVGIEIYADSANLNVSALMLFQGQAELLGGLVGITITIEAKGTISRTADRTDCAAQVTFAIEISIFLIIDIDFSTSWEEQRQIA